MVNKYILVSFTGGEEGEKYEPLNLFTITSFQKFIQGKLTEIITNYESQNNCGYSFSYYITIMGLNDGIFFESKLSCYIDDEICFSPSLSKSKFSKNGKSSNKSTVNLSLVKLKLGYRKEFTFNELILYLKNKLSKNPIPDIPEKNNDDNEEEEEEEIDEGSE